MLSHFVGSILAYVYGSHALDWIALLAAWAVIAYLNWKLHRGL